MSIESVTTDDFSMLSIEEHEEALSLYDTAIFNAAQEIIDPEQDPVVFAEDRDKLTRLITLRKVHQGRHDELVQEQQGSTVATAA
jgi:hypothetical protein